LINQLWAMISWELPTIAVLIRMHGSSQSYPSSGLSPADYILLVIVLLKYIRKRVFVRIDAFMEHNWGSNSESFIKLNEDASFAKLNEQREIK